jgi:protein-S-isoprenylcysteine O-methyltransferase Ste14
MTWWLDFLAWIACVVYSTIPSFWFLIHPRPEYWRSRRRSPYLLLLPAWWLMWVVIGIVTVGWRHVRLYSTTWTWIPAGLLFASGFWLYLRSSKTFSAQQLGGLPEVLGGEKRQALVTTGIRAHVRHPVYLAHFCEMLAWSIGTGLIVSYALTAFALVTGAVMIGMEERELEKRFGTAYTEYRARVPAIIPKIRAKG